jgi:hypothetical protein
MRLAGQSWLVANRSKAQAALTQRVLSRLAMQEARLKYLRLFTLLLGFFSTTQIHAADAEDRRAMIERDARVARGDIEGPRLIPPDRFDSIGALLPQLYAVVRGHVTDISYDYLDCQGPRTVVKLDRIQTLIGEKVDTEIELRTFGGPLPNGNYVSASELPRYAIDASYVVFLRNTDWRFSPVTGDLAFREEVIADRPVLVDSDGVAVSGVGEIGVERRTGQLTEPAGLHVVGADEGREVLQPDDEGAILKCERGTKCVAPEIAAEAEKRASHPATKDPTNRFARPAVLKGIGSAELVSAISTEEMVDRIRRYSDDLGIAIGGRLQLEPRLGCWDVTLTDPWK